MLETYQGDISELTEDQVRDLDLSLEDWEELLLEEADDRKRVGVMRYAERMIDELLDDDIEVDPEAPPDEAWPGEVVGTPVLPEVVMGKEDRGSVAKGFEHVPYAIPGGPSHPPHKPDKTQIQVK